MGIVFALLDLELLSVSQKNWITGKSQKTQMVKKIERVRDKVKATLSTKSID